MLSHDINIIGSGFQILNTATEKVCLPKLCFLKKRSGSCEFLLVIVKARFRYM